MDEVEMLREDIRQKIYEKKEQFGKVFLMIDTDRSGTSSLWLVFARPSLLVGYICRLFGVFCI